MKKTVLEIIQEIKKGEAWVNDTQKVSKIYLNKMGNLQLEGEENSFAQNNSTVLSLSAKYELEQETFSFEEAVAKLKEGYEIESIYSGNKYVLYEGELWCRQVYQRWSKANAISYSEMEQEWYIRESIAELTMKY